MLVLARQCNESIMIGDEIEIMVVALRGDKVRLGITAPRTVPVFRKEIYRGQESRAGTEAAPEQSDHPAATPSPESSPQATADPFLAAAIEEARAGESEGGLPIGSVLVRDGQIIARGHNRRVQHGDPMAHAEIDCLTRAGRQKTYRDTVLYSTLMPCYLCSGAAVQFGIGKVVVGESVNFTGAPQLMRSHGIEVVDVADPTCIEMMRAFVAAHPELWNEDIGK